MVAVRLQICVRVAIDVHSRFVWAHFSFKLDVTNRTQLLSVLQSCVGTKFIGRWASMACNIALDAVNTVALEENGRKEIDIKRYARIEKVIFTVVCRSFTLNDSLMQNVYFRFREELSKTRKY